MKLTGVFVFTRARTLREKAFGVLHTQRPPMPGQYNKDDSKSCLQEYFISVMHRLSEVLKLDLLQCVSKFIGGVRSGHNWEGFRIPKRFIQVFRSAG